MTARMSVSEIRARMAEAIGQLKEPDRWLVVTRYGEAVAAMISLNMLWRLTEEATAATAQTGKGGIAVAPTLETAAEHAPPEFKDDSHVELPRVDADTEELLDRIDAVRREMGLRPYRP